MAFRIRPASGRAPYGNLNNAKEFLSVLPSIELVSVELNLFHECLSHHACVAKKSEYRGTANHNVWQ